MERSIATSTFGMEYAYLYQYVSKRSGMPNETTQLILNFKGRNPEAVNRIKEGMIEQVASMVPYLRDRLRCRYLVSLPSSSKGGLNRPCEDVCVALAAKFPWLTHLPGALERTTAVQKSAYAYPGHRPGYQQHKDSIRYARVPVVRASHQTIIIVDDVITRGETSGACRDILMQATKCERVFGLFAAKTVYA